MIELKSRPSVPPRKWYTLEQASRKLTKELNQEITVEDMVHYLFLGYFLPYIHTKYRINNDIIFNNKYEIKLNEKNRLIEERTLTKELKYPDLVILSDFCNLAIQGVEYPTDHTTKWLEYYADNLFDQMYEEYGELNDDNVLDIMEKFFHKHKKLTFGIDGLLALKIDCLFYGSALLSEELEIINKGLKIKEQDLLTPPMIALNQKGLFLRLILEKEIYIPASELIIVYDDLIRIEQDIRVDLRDFATNADEQGRMPDNREPYIYGKSEQKTIEKTVSRIEILEPKEPIQYEKEYTKKLVIESCLATRKDYPTAGKNTIVKAVLSKISKDPKMKGLKLQSERTYTNILDNMGIEFPNEKGNTIEISKVTIVKP